MMLQPNTSEQIKTELRRLVYLMQAYSGIPFHRRSVQARSLATSSFLSRADITKINAQGKGTHYHLAMCQWMLKYHEECVQKYPKLSKDIYLNIEVKPVPPHMLYAPAAIAYITDELIEHTIRLDDMIEKLERKRPRYKSYRIK